MKKHKGYSQATLQARAMCVQMRPLLEPDKQDVELRRLEARLEKVRRRKPNYITGRQVFVMELNETATTFAERGST